MDSSPDGSISLSESLLSEAILLLRNRPQGWSFNRSKAAVHLETQEKHVILCSPLLVFFDHRAIGFGFSVVGSVPLRQTYP